MNRAKLGEASTVLIEKSSEGLTVCIESKILSNLKSKIDNADTQKSFIKQLGHKIKH